MSKKTRHKLFEIRKYRAVWAIKSPFTGQIIPAGYLYEVDGNKPLGIDVVTNERKEYAVTKVWSKADSPSHVYPGGHRKPAYLNLKTPEETVTITSENDVIHIEDLEGVIIGNGTWRIMHALEPGGKAPLGGFILERTS